MIENFKEEFQAWAETKDPKESYGLSNPIGCALGQFVKSIHPDAIPKDTGYYTGKYMGTEFHIYPLEVYACAIGNYEDKIVLGEFNTFGELAKRLKKVNE